VDNEFTAARPLPVVGENVIAAPFRRRLPRIVPRCLSTRGTRRPAQTPFSSMESNSVCGRFHRAKKS